MNFMEAARAICDDLNRQRPCYVCMAKAKPRHHGVEYPGLFRALCSDECAGWYSHIRAEWEARAQ
jgi:hypothetical protein